MFKTNRVAVLLCLLLCEARAMDSLLVPLLQAFVAKYLHSFETNVADSECKRQLKYVYSGALEKNLWAYEMIDASSKLQPGLLTGNIMQSGNYDECLKVRGIYNGTSIRGKYCASFLISENQYSIYEFVNLLNRERGNGQESIKNLLNADGIPGFYFSLCIPSACTAGDIADYARKTFDGDLKVYTNDKLCQHEEEINLEPGDIAVIVLLLFILLLLIASTAYDIYLKQCQKTVRHPLYLAFSVLQNGKHLFLIRADENQLGCLYGIRFVSIMWIVAGHRFVSYAGIPALNYVDIFEWKDKLYSQYIQAATVAVETFFFLSGMMISYGYWKTIHKPKSPSFVPLYYLHRLLRITPALVMVYLVNITVFRYLGSGPAWPVVVHLNREPCMRWWWTFFLYIQNYINHKEDELCIIPTWYISADMQLYILSPLILLPLGYVAVRKTRRTVYSICGVALLASVLIPLIIRFCVEYKNYLMTHDRIVSWMVGFIVGIVLNEMKASKSKFKITPRANLLIWVLVLTGMITILLTMHEVRYHATKTESILFDVFHRLGWCLGLAWITFSCTTGTGGFVNAFLSYPAFQVLSRLTYSMYLTHYLVLSLSIGQTRFPPYVSDYVVFYEWCGDIICTTAVSLIWFLAFESPMIAIEKVVFARSLREKNSNSVNSRRKIAHEL